LVNLKIILDNKKPVKIKILSKSYGEQKKAITGYVIFKEKESLENSVKEMNGVVVEDRHIQVDYSVKKILPVIFYLKIEFFL
jgi:RNA recognition motif-containing protein